MKHGYEYGYGYDMEQVVDTKNFGIVECKYG